MIHWPIERAFFDSWAALEELKKQGLTKSIGVSNFQVIHLQYLATQAAEMSVVNQVERHPRLNQALLVKFDQDHHIIAGAFDLRLYATVYALSSNFAKQISVFFFSSFADKTYDQIGFQHTYLILGIIVGIVTLICAFTLTKEDPVQAGEVKEAKN